MIEDIKELAGNLITDECVCNLFEHTNETEFLETLVFEISLGINKSNANNTIKALEKIFEYKPLLKSILIKSTSFHYYNNPGFDIVYKYFEVPYKSRHLGKIDKLILENNNDELILLDISKSYDLQRYYRKAIEYENVKFLTYLLLNDRKEIPDIDAFNVAIRIGNPQIIRLLLSYGLDLNMIETEVYKTSHHYDIIAFAEIQPNSTVNMNSIHDNCRSLYYKFVNDEQFLERSIDFDLSCVHDDYSRQSNLNNLITKNCVNIITNNNFNFNVMNLVLSISHKNHVLFDHIISKMRITNEYIEGLDINILQAAISTEDLYFVQQIVKKNKTLIYDLDRYGNNILYFAVRQDSIDIFKFILSVITKDEFTKLFQSVNAINESPMAYCMRYNQVQYIELIAKL